MTSYAKTLDEAKNMLKKAGVPDADVDAWLLFEDSFEMNRSQYFLKCNEETDEGALSLYMERLRRRCNREPLQYITGSACFMGYDFRVTPDVLIPRYDTEVLVEEVLKTVRPGDRVLDMCTGSGCIIESIALMSAISEGIGADISKAAVAVASDNAKRHDLNNVKIIESDLFNNITGEFDVIVSNPPYIRSDDIPELMREVKDCEPVLALDGSADGLKFYRLITEHSVSFLKEGGSLIYEIGFDQAKDVVQILKENGYTDTKVIKDLAGLDRVVYGRKQCLTN